MGEVERYYFIVVCFIAMVFALRCFSPQDTGDARANSHISSFKPFQQ